MNKDEIINKYAADKVVEKLLKGYTPKNFTSPYIEDLAQDIYIELLNKDSGFIEFLFTKNELKFYIRRIIKNNLFSKTSPFYIKYQKFRKQADELSYKDSDDEI